ncbi:DNA topoisomerase 3 [Aerococcus viridans]
MNNTVILAEKPSQAQAYAESFDTQQRKDGYYIVSGNGFNEAIITYGFGHLVSLFNPEEYQAEWKSWHLNTLPIFPSEYKFKVTKDKKKQYNIVKKYLDKAENIVIATDTDREGEAIARLIIRLSGNSNKPTKRLWINSLEKDEIQKGFQNLKNGEDYYSSFVEAETRQIADWLVGMNLTRLYTLQMQKNGMGGVFSVGRVQTPTLFLIYQRQQEIENFVKKPFFELYAHFNHQQGNYTGKYKQRFNTEEELDDFKNQNQLNNDMQGLITDVTKEEKQTFAPKLFSLSDLQSEANKKLNLGASETLKIAQSLYEKKYTSYPRSDSNFIGSPEYSYLKDNLDNYLSLVGLEIAEPQLEENKRYVNSAKVAEHYAIIPTKTVPNLEKLTENERKIYQLILLRTIAIFEKPYRYEETTILTNTNGIEFKTTGKVEIDKGFKRLIKDDKDKKDNAEVLPAVAKSDMVTSNFETKQGETKPPKPYTEGTLLTAMKNVGRSMEEENDQDILKETEGIGTEATRASIIENIKAKGYVKLEKKYLKVTEKGISLCEVIKEDPIANASMTAKWEKYLNKIKEKQGTQEAFIGSIERFIEHTMENVPNNFDNSNIQQHAKQIQSDKVIGTCPKCQKNIIDKGKFYGCDDYPNCKFTLPKRWSGKTIPKSNVQQLLEKGITSEIKGFKSKKGKAFNAKLKIENDKITFDFDK